MQNGMDLSEDNVKDLSWVGLHDTGKFKEQFDTKEKVEQWQQRVGELYYKLKERQENKPTNNSQVNQQSNDNCSE